MTRAARDDAAGVAVATPRGGIVVHRLLTGRGWTISKVVRRAEAFRETGAFADLDYHHPLPVPRYATARAAREAAGAGKWRRAGGGSSGVPIYYQRPGRHRDFDEYGEPAR